MNQPTPQPDNLEPADAELLELYLDGQLSGDRAAQAETRLSEVPAMRAALAQQEQIDSSLKRQFQPPALSEAFMQKLLAGSEETAEPLEAQLPEERSPEEEPLKVTPRTSDASYQRRMQLLAIAASLAAVTVWSVSGWEQLNRLWQGPRGYARLTVGEVYQNAVQRGFEPDWLCEDDQQFAQTFADRQGQGLLLEPLPEGARMAGLAYLDGLTPRSTSLFALVEDQPVLVMVGRTELMPKPLLKADEELGITVFTRRLGGLTLVEVTPFDTPRVMNSLTLAEVPAAPTGHMPGAPLPE